MLPLRRKQVNRDRASLVFLILTRCVSPDMLVQLQIQPQVLGVDRGTAVRGRWYAHKQSIGCI
jgi:hypothetical protein